MMEILSSLKEYQLGTIPGWGLLGTVLLFWWKGLPGLIEAWEKRSSGIEARLNASMEAYVTRTNQQIADADKRYDELERHHQQCREDQDILRDRLAKQDQTIAQQNDTIGRQNATIMTLSEQVNALKASNVQQQIAQVEKMPHSAHMDRAISVLKEIK